MPEQGVKFLCKRAIENGQRQLTPVEKELLKKELMMQKLSRFSCGGVGSNDGWLGELYISLQLYPF